MENTDSSQPRFDKKASPEEFFSRILKLYDEEEMNMPEYGTDSRKLDVWLNKFVPKEPHLAGVVNSVAAIDKNRGWSVTGGRNQVNRVTDLFHNFQCAPGLIGWRPSFGYASKSFWGTNMGAVVELGTEGPGGPVRSLYNVDPTKCVLTQSPEYPLKYYPPKGTVQKWKYDQFFRVVSSPNLDENMNGLSDCAVMRAVGIAQLMIALYRHDAEQLLARAPRGFLILQGVRQAQWENAMKAEEVQLDANEMKYFGALVVLASASEKIDAKLLALSQLPQSFNMKEWMDMTLYGYALCFGYDASEFYPVQYGALGRGNETQVQHEKATAKGRLDFVLGFQEQMQGFLPETVAYAVEQRDDQGDLLQASVQQAWVNVISKMYTSTDSAGVPLITNEEGRVLLAEKSLIPSSWSPTADVKSTDTEESDEDPSVDPSEAPQSPEDGKALNPVAAKPTAQWLRRPELGRRALIREALMENAAVVRAALKYPQDAIVRYEYGTKYPSGRITTLWESGEDLLKPRYR